MNIKRGVLCGLTGDKPEFEGECKQYIQDIVAVNKKLVDQEEYGDYDEDIEVDKKPSSISPIYGDGRGWFPRNIWLKILVLIILYLNVCGVVRLVLVYLGLPTSGLFETFCGVLVFMKIYEVLDTH